MSWLFCYTHLSDTWKENPSWLRIRGNHIQRSNKNKVLCEFMVIHPNLIKLDIFFESLMLFPMSYLWAMMISKKVPNAFTFNLGLVHTRSQVPSHVNNSQHGDKVSTFEPQKIVTIWLTIIKFISWLFYTKLHAELGVQSSKKLDPTLNRSPKPHLQKVVPNRHMCHTWDLGLGTPCAVTSPKSMLSTTQIARTDLKWLETWDPMWTGPWMRTSNSFPSLTLCIHLYPCPNDFAPDLFLAIYFGPSLLVHIP